MLSHRDVRDLPTPIPTPTIVQATGSFMVALSVATMVSGAAPAVKFSLPLVAVAVTVGAALLHPYRRQLRAYAEEKNVARVPSISMLVPLMLWWLALMLAPLAAPWSIWGVGATFFIVAALAWLLFPHVDGTRRLAYA